MAERNLQVHATSSGTTVYDRTEQVLHYFKPGKPAILPSDEAYALRPDYWRGWACCWPKGPYEASLNQPVPAQKLFETLLLLSLQSRLEDSAGLMENLRENNPHKPYGLEQALRRLSDALTEFEMFVGNSDW